MWSLWLSVQPFSSFFLSDSFQQCCCLQDAEEHGGSCTNTEEVNLGLHSLRDLKNRPSIKYEIYVQRRQFSSGNWIWPTREGESADINPLMELHLHHLTLTWQMDRVPPRENKIAYAALQRWRMNEDEQRPSDKHMDDLGSAAWGKTSTWRATLGGPWTKDKWIGAYLYSSRCCRHLNDIGRQRLAQI